MRLAILPLFPLLIALALGCAVAPNPRCLQQDDLRSRQIFLVDHGYHSGIAVSAAEIGAGFFPELEDLPESRFYEFGWGARSYYMHPDPGVRLGLAALFGFSPGVLHVAGFQDDPRQFFSAMNIQVLYMPALELERVVRFIDATFERGTENKSRLLGPGLYGQSAFFPSARNFSFLNTCHSWAAEALEAGGC